MEVTLNGGENKMERIALEFEFYVSRLLLKTFFFSDGIMLGALIVVIRGEIAEETWEKGLYSWLYYE